MDFIKAFSDWIVLALSGIGSVLLYHYKKNEDHRRMELERINEKLRQLEKEYHRLDRTQAEISIEIKAIKEDIGYIRLGLDKILERI